MSCGQQPKDRKSQLLEDIKSRAVGENAKFEDTAHWRMISNMYGDSILVQIDNFLRDTTLNDSAASSFFRNRIKRVLLDRKMQDAGAQVGMINDFEEIYTASQLIALEHFSDSISIEKTRMTIVVVTIDSLAATKEKFNDIILSIQNNWLLGVLNSNYILLGINASGGKVKICSNEGLKSKLPEEFTKKAIDEVILPEFRQKKYFEGTKEGILRLIQSIP